MRTVNQVDVYQDSRIECDWFTTSLMEIGQRSDWLEIDDILLCKGRFL